MYSLACINLSSEAHLTDALGSSQYPVLKVPKGSGPTLAPRCGARKNYTSIPHAVSRKIFKNFSDPFSGAPGALRLPAPRVAPCEQGFRGWSLSLYQPPPFCEGGNL